MCRECVRLAGIATRDRLRADKARSEAITRERRAAEAPSAERRAEIKRIAQAAQTAAQDKRYAAVRRERELLEARIRAELEAERATAEERQEFNRIARNARRARKRAAERARLPSVLAELPRWCKAHPWPPEADRLREAREEARSLRVLAFYST